MKITLGSILVCIGLLGVFHVQGMDDMSAGAFASSDIFGGLEPLIEIDLGLHSHDVQVQEVNAKQDQGLSLPIVIETLPVEETAQKPEKPARSVKSTKIIKRKASADLTPPPAKRQHVVKLTAIKEHVCQDCGKIFNTPSFLQRHMHTHTGKKPFSCDDCGKGFAREYDLSRHMLIHTGKKTFSCSDCGKKFARKDNFRSHMRKAHNAYE